MLETKYSKFLTILLIVIIVAIIGLAGYLGYTYYRNYSIDKESEKFVSTFVEEVSDKTNTTGETNSSGDEATTLGSISSNLNSASTESTNNTNSTSNSAVANKTYKGFNTLGTIEIPSIDIKYPVLDYPPTVKKLETSVVVTYPTKDVKLNTVGNVVIVGHNYRNGIFFSNLKKVANGDKISITGLDGKKVTYKVYNTFTAGVNDTSFYNRDTDGKMEITLSTCTDDSTARFIVEARAE